MESDLEEVRRRLDAVRFLCPEAGVEEGPQVQRVRRALRSRRAATRARRDLPADNGFRARHAEM
jgi:hypothetical protein